MKNISILVFVLALCLPCWSVSAEPPPPSLQGTWVIQKMEQGGQTLTMADLSAQMNAAQPKVDLRAAHIAFTFEGSRLMARTEMMMKKGDRGYFTCASSVGIDVEWGASQIMVPATVSGESQFRSIVREGEGWGDIDEWCRANLKKGALMYRMEGDTLVMSQDGVLLYLKKGESYLPYREYIEE